MEREETCRGSTPSERRHVQRKRRRASRIPSCDSQKQRGFHYSKREIYIQKPDETLNGEREDRTRSRDQMSFLVMETSLWKILEACDFGFGLC